MHCQESEQVDLWLKILFFKSNITIQIRSPLLISLSCFLLIKQQLLKLGNLEAHLSAEESQIKRRYKVIMQGVNEIYNTITVISSRDTVQFLLPRQHRRILTACLEITVEFSHTTAISTCPCRSLTMGEKIRMASSLKEKSNLW